MVKVLFVCMGNICRSPTAEGVFRKLIADEKLNHVIEIDSAGTHAYHVGNRPDPRSQEAALKRGIDLSKQCARKVNELDFELFDYILPMDRENYNNLLEICPTHLEDKLRLFLEFAEAIPEMEVPDPYYGGNRGFERVLDMVEEASKGLLWHIKSRHLD